MWRWAPGNHRMSARKRALTASAPVCGSHPRLTTALDALEACKSASNQNARTRFARAGTARARVRARVASSALPAVGGGPHGSS